MNDTKNMACDCKACIGPACTCGCQKPVATAACACGPACNCGPTCGCSSPAKA